MKNKLGFTLLELLVVVLIIGILAAIALPQYRLAVDKARYATLMDITRTIAEANERFYMVHDKYSTKFKELDIDIQANSIDGGTANFDWGQCDLYGQQEVQCTNNTLLNNQFIIHYNFDPSFHTHGVFCTAKGLTKKSRYDRICQTFGKYYTQGSNTCSVLGGCSVYLIRR